MSGIEFYNTLKRKTHQFIMGAYDCTDGFPKSELYGSADQLKRAALSIMLNYNEGFGRRRIKEKLRFFEISYGSIRECKYLIFLACERKWIYIDKYKILFSLLDEIGAMMWSIIQGTEEKIAREKQITNNK